MGLLAEKPCKNNPLQNNGGDAWESNPPTGAFRHRPPVLKTGPPTSDGSASEPGGFYGVWGGISRGERGRFCPGGWGSGGGDELVEYEGDYDDDDVADGGGDGSPVAEDDGASGAELG